MPWKGGRRGTATAQPSTTVSMSRVLRSAAMPRRGRSAMSAGIGRGGCAAMKGRDRAPYIVSTGTATRMARAPDIAPNCGAPALSMRTVTAATTTSSDRRGPCRGPARTAGARAPATTGRASGARPRPALPTAPGHRPGSPENEPRSAAEVGSPLPGGFRKRGRDAGCFAVARHGVSGPAVRVASLFAAGVGEGRGHDGRETA